MRLLKGAFDGAGLPLYLAPYGVVPTGHEQGIIEVIPQSKSRAQLVGGAVAVRVCSGREGCLLGSRSW